MKANNSNSKVFNFGCRLNAYESEVIKSILTKNNLNNTLVVNTCAVTNEAERQAQQTIRKLIKEYPNKKIVVTGCAAQICPEKYLAIEGVNSVIGNIEKLKNESWSNIEKKDVKNVSNIMNSNELNKNIVEKFDGKARAYVEIQQGCNHRCTFCIIPYGRGNNRSIPFGLIVERIKKLVSNGYKEIVLTGVDITDYGIDLPGKPRLTDIIKRLLKLIPELNQLRLSSIDCAELNEDFFELVKSEERLMPHFHISLQSGDDMILKRMKRRHNRKQSIKFCQKLKKIRPNILLGADLIAGFPTETNIMFNNTCTLVKECDLTYLHVFPYSSRYSTPASRMPQVPDFQKKLRAKKLRSLGEEQLHFHLKSSIGKQKTILIEKSFENYSIGKTQEFSSIKVNEKLIEGKLYKLLVKSIDSNFLIV